MKDEAKFPLGLMFVSPAALWMILFESTMGFRAYENGEAALDIPIDDENEIKRQIRGIAIEAIRASWNEPNYVPQMVTNAMYFLSVKEIKEIGNQFFNIAVDQYLESIKGKVNG